MGKIQKLWKKVCYWWYGRKKVAVNIQDDNYYVWDEYDRQVTIIPNKTGD